MQIKFSLVEGAGWNHHETRVIPHASMDGLREDIKNVLELHEFRSEAYKRKYIERWGQEQYDKSYPAAPPKESNGTQEEKR